MTLCNLHCARALMAWENSSLLYIRADSGIESTFCKKYKSESKVDESHT